MSSKLDALNELRIERKVQENSGPRLNRRSKCLMVFVLGSCVLFLSVLSLKGILAKNNGAGEGSVSVERDVQEDGSQESLVEDVDFLRVEIENSDNNVLLEASGYVTAQRVATVSSTSLGLIDQVYVEEGAEVQKGQVLATLDSKLSELDLRMASQKREFFRSDIVVKTAEVVDSKRRLDQQLDLLNSNFSNQSEIDAINTELKIVEANLERAKINYSLNEIEIERLQKRLEDLVIRAPFSGIVTVKNAQPGEIIAPSSAGGGHTRTGICTIVDMNSLEIEVDINESFLNKVSIGQKVVAELHAYEGWNFNARVKKIVPTVERSKATVRIRIEIVERSNRILPNMAVTVKFFDELMG